MRIGTFRICSAKTIRKFLKKTIDLRDNHEWYAYIAIYESRILGMCFYRSLNLLPATVKELMKEALIDEEKINGTNAIDIDAVLRNYQQVSFL